MSCKNEIEIITGDININILNNNDRSWFNYLNMLCEHGFLSCVNTPTREEAWLDHLFLKCPSLSTYDVTSMVSYSKITDHSPTVLLFNLIHNQADSLSYNRQINTESKFYFKAVTDYVKLTQRLQVIDWTILKSLNVDDAVDHFIKFKVTNNSNKFKKFKFL